jgi:hypothetical protein
VAAGHGDLADVPEPRIDIHPDPGICHGEKGVAFDLPFKAYGRATAQHKQAQQQYQCPFFHFLAPFNICKICKFMSLKNKMKVHVLYTIFQDNATENRSSVPLEAGGMGEDPLPHLHNLDADPSIAIANGCVARLTIMLYIASVLKSSPEGEGFSPIPRRRQ